MCSYLILLNTNPFFYFNIYLEFFSRKKIEGACTWFSDCIKLCKNQCALSKETCTSQLKAKSPQKSWMRSKELRVGKDGGRVLLVGLQLPHGLALWKRHTGIAQTWGSAKELERAFSGSCCSFLEFEHKLKWSPKWNFPPPDWYPRGEPSAPNLRIGASPQLAVVISQGSYGRPKTSLPLACRGDRNKRGHSKKYTCSLTQFQGATQHCLQKPPLGSHSYSQTLGNGQEKRVFSQQTEE